VLHQGPGLAAATGPQLPAAPRRVPLLLLPACGYGIIAHCRGCCLLVIVVVCCYCCCCCRRCC
jgi:hypothetical protein